MPAVKKILIVDDQIEVRSLILFALSNMSYRLLTASDADAALASYDRHHPDIIIMDVMMPGDLSGLDACREIRKRERGRSACKIIFLSALTHQEDIARGLAAGADAYITKPFSPMALIREIHRLSKI